MKTRLSPTIFLDMCIFSTNVKIMKLFIVQNASTNLCVKNKQTLLQRQAKSITVSLVQFTNLSSMVSIAKNVFGTWLPLLQIIKSSKLGDLISTDLKETVAVKYLATHLLSCLCQ